MSLCVGIWISCIVMFAGMFDLMSIALILNLMPAIS